MRIYLFLVLIGFAFASCSVQKKHGESDKIVEVECHELLDSLASICRPLKYDLLQIDYSGFSVESFKDLTEMQRVLKGIPRTEKEQRMYLFTKLLDRINANGECNEHVTVDDIHSRLGDPSYIHQGEGFHGYLLNSGLDCPNCEVSVSRVFENCDYIRFHFNGNRLTRVSYDLFMTML